ncbi:hypothetical protein FACS1894111_11150 [Clostridia bacterium]|nr:hypothetical protein FACS1894111_11150 [Clostridia bacterium]
MEANRGEELEALEVLKDYNPKMEKALGEIIPELRGEKKEDTAEYVNHVFKGINWELQVVNGTLSLLNEKGAQIDKASLNRIVEEINDAYTSKNDAVLADLVERQLLPFVQKLQGDIVQALA